MSHIIFEHDCEELKHSVPEICFRSVRAVLDTYDVEYQARLELVLDRADVNLLLFKLNLDLPL
jgi:hypothetical protein